MYICTQCMGSGKTIPNNLAISPGGINAGLTFTDTTQVQEALCNYCLGTKYVGGMMA